MVLEEDKMSRVIVIDSGNIQFTAINVHRMNRSIPAPYTYLSMVVGYLKTFEVTLEDKVIIAQDFGSWRKDVDKTYKAQRKGDREKQETTEWWEQKYAEFNELYKKMAICVPWHFVKIYKMEADDIASVCCRYYPNDEVILISADRDWEQLAIFKNVKIYSPRSHKIKDIPNPMKVLLEKIQGDKSDNLLDKPSSEAEFDNRRKIVDLTKLPLEIERPIKEELNKLVPKNLYTNKIPYGTIQARIKKLYRLEDK